MYPSNLNDVGLIKAAPQLKELYIRTDGMCTRGKIPQITPVRPLSNLYTEF